MPLEGQAEFFIDGFWRSVPVGTAVFAPSGTVHTFRNAGDEPQRMLIHATPSGLESFFEECAEEYAPPRPPIMERLVMISAVHGIQYGTSN